MSSECPVCNSRRTALIISRKNTPVHQNLLMSGPSEARSITRADLEIMCCQECGFVFISDFDIGKLSYGDQYDNNQTCSSTFQVHLNQLVDRILGDERNQNCRFVEVGCGQGQFLRRLIEEGLDNTGTGFDPSYTGPAHLMDGRLNFEKRYYDSNCAEVPADVVVCRHVIEHVPKPLDLLKSVREALSNSPGARLYFETPCVEWIFRNRVVWDFFYEHCSLFSAESLRRVFEVSGFEVTHVDHIFDDQYLWLEAVVGTPVKTNSGSSNVLKLAQAYSEAEDAILENWKQRILGLKSQGLVALWGAGAKGVTFANLVDPNCQLLECVVDLNPNKQGKFIPGTGHPIIDYKELGSRNIKSVILMNPNYLSENQAFLQQAGLENIQLFD
ncbi:MAG: class I SAM-dependent methyltransferase [Nitrospinota bacterium]|nr:class I SAM-dependent methyltransferase [Nitrospinota bacterium]